MTSYILGRCLIISTMLSLFVVTGCSPGTPPGVSQQALDILTSCPDDGRVAVDVQIDATGSSSSIELGDQEVAALDDAATRVALCGGRLRVSAFTASVSSSVIVFNDTIELHGATDAARLRRVGPAVEEAIEQIIDVWPDAVARLQEDGGGTDVVARFSSAEEFSRQLRDGHQLYVVIVTDGMHNADGINPAQTTDIREAQSLADAVTWADLEGADIQVTGIGRTADGVMSTEVISRLKTFYARGCELMNTARCTISTDYTGGR